MVSLTFVCTVFFTGTPSAQAGINVWTSHGPGGSGSAFAIDLIEPRRVYAGTGGGVFAIEQAQVVGTARRRAARSRRWTTRWWVVAW